MFRNLLIVAGIAGLPAALILTLIQALWVTPLILRAETYESGAEQPHDHAHEAVEPAAAPAEQIAAEHEHTDAQHMHEHGDVHPDTAHAADRAAPHEHGAAHEHHHDADEWKPADGLERTLYTLASNIAMGFGYGLLLAALYTFLQRPLNAARGMLFGIAGFAIFFGAPALGLAPELPGTAAAELAVRQQWWIGTAAATALGLGLIFLQRNWLLRAVGAVILVVPHLLGAPQPVEHASLAPADLQARFRVATTLANALFWLLLGLLSALAYKKLCAQQPSAH